MRLRAERKFAFWDAKMPQMRMSPSRTGSQLASPWRRRRASAERPGARGAETAASPACPETSIILPSLAPPRPRP
ncbi:hypothetical protein BE04_15625 [Sorangium cellulosum]|uniref:Uncharacterized protein n=2 Tax=Sorangium cellulosum TaxID=56 RepID=A0A150Q314_SORCE|nr:hypothetical protein SCE1572_00380 [Sorangium cellulosum So0157-2]KYF62405.1 hypothetical protein BE04_15625 [Sorangium cellulosum]